MTNLPPKPDFRTPDQQTRLAMFGAFRYQPIGGGNIRILGSWPAENIVRVSIPQLKDIEGCNPTGTIYFHKKGVEQLEGFFDEVERRGLKHLILTWGGSFVPRFIRGSNQTLSNHAWGTAFDINAAWNGLGKPPAPKGAKGSVVELVSIANDFGFFWGGHYRTRLDGMHFELAVLDRFPKSYSFFDTVETTPQNVGQKIDEIKISPEPTSAGQATAPQVPTAIEQSKTESVVQTSPDQNAVQPTVGQAEVEQPAPQGVFKKLAAGITTLFSGTAVYTAAEKMSGVSISQTVLILIVVGIVIAFLGFCFWAWLDAWKTAQRVRLEAEAKTDPQRKDLKWI